MTERDVVLTSSSTTSSTSTSIIALLNEYNNDDKILAGLQLLVNRYGIQRLIVRFTQCDYYASSNKEFNRITICPRIRTPSFNRLQSTHVEHDLERVTHFAAVILHEFGHVLNNGGRLTWKNMSSEQKASKFASEFISGA